MGELNLSPGIGALGRRGGEIEELREGGKDGLWSQVASGVEVVEFAILAADIVAIRKVQCGFGEAESGAEEANIGKVDFGVEKRGLSGGEGDCEVAVRDFIEAGQGFINKRGFGIQIGEMGVGAHTDWRLQDAGEAERERVFQRVDAGVYDGGIEACELLFEAVCVRLAGEECGSVEEIQRGVIRRLLQSSLEGLVGIFKGCRCVLGQSGAAGCKIGLSSREWRCGEGKNQGEERGTK